MTKGTHNVTVEKTRSLEDPVKDDLIGKADIKLDKVFSSGHEEEWIKIKRMAILTNGQVKLVMKFTPV
ncbi:unnamed protein product [Rhizophagus irregularis]|uniref:Uncharacterized protein n=1 Tax=Rhizophagus irregularis TaxID=588596 RepID=A0A2N1MBD5_9GLOM|nr:hypothetical protein RhiirC2_795531 [Rhizophagus irregularis]CAB4396853.1 unnamed protein product [Rhizophagus irregularis]CAB5371034.1 unnamed protein product [Rhizophagus irregularis]